MYPQTRRLPYRKQLKRFVISCEGSQTEREYFTCIQPLCWDRSYVDILTSRNETSPLHVLDRLLEEYQPGYKKHINRQLFTKEAVSLAVERSISSCPDGVLPLGSVGTNVGELVRRILADTARVS